MKDCLFEWTFTTRTFFLDVTAVGCFTALSVEASKDSRDLNVIGFIFALTLILVDALPVGPGGIRVPGPRGLLTFLIRSGIHSRMTCSIVRANKISRSKELKGMEPERFSYIRCMTSDPRNLIAVSYTVQLLIFY